MSRSSCLALLCILATPAHAAESSRGKLYIELAFKSFEAKDYAEALTSFRKAEQFVDELGDPAGLRYNIARCLEELGRHREAYEAFEIYLKLDDSKEGQKAATDRMKVLDPKVFGGLRVECDARGAMITFGEEEGVKCPHAWPRLPAGPYELGGRSAGGVDTSASPAVVAGKVGTYTLKFPAKLEVEGPEGTEVEVDGEARGALPLEAFLLAPGAHAVVVRRAGQPEWRMRITSVPGEVGMVNVPVAGAPVKAETPPGVADATGEAEPAAGVDLLAVTGWSLVGVGVATGVVSGVLWGSALDASSAADDAISEIDLEAYDTAKSDVESANQAAVALTMVATAALVSGVGVLIWGD